MRRQVLPIQEENILPLLLAQHPPLPVKVNPYQLLSLLDTYETKPSTAKQNENSIWNELYISLSHGHGHFIVIRNL